LKSDEFILEEEEVQDLFEKGQGDALYGCVDKSCKDPRYRRGVISWVMRWEVFLAVRSDDEASGRKPIQTRSLFAREIPPVEVSPLSGFVHDVDSPMRDRRKTRDALDGAVRISDLRLRFHRGHAGLGLKDLSDLEGTSGREDDHTATF
jgi:hypothetical protein